MDIRNCKKCGRLFGYVSRGICPECVKKEEEDFDLVKKFLEDNHDATAEGVEAGTGIPLEQIMRYLEAGRLQLRGGGGLASLLRCRSCGRPIPEGILCEACAGRLAREFQEAAKPAKTGERQMHTWDSKRDGRK